MKTADALTTPPAPCQLSAGSSVEAAEGLFDARALFSATLAQLDQRVSQEPRALFWLLTMARQLGLEDREALELTSPYPHMQQQLAEQLSLVNAKAEAERAELQDDVVTAIEHYTRHLNVTPHDEISRLKLGRLLLSHGEREQVRALYRAGLTISEGPCLIALKAELMIAHRSFDDAYLIATEAWEMAPTHPEVLITLSKTQRWMLNHGAERDSLDRALQAHAHHPVALALYLQAEDPTWLPHLRLDEVKRVFTQRPTRHMHLAFINALLQAYKYDLALAEARRLILRDPKNLEARLVLARSLSYLGHTSEACEALDLLLERDERHPVGLYLKCFLSRLSHELNGEEALARLQELSMRSSMAALLYSQALSLFGRTREAHQICLNLHRKYPRRAAALSAYCHSLIELGEHQLVKRLCLDRLDYYPLDLPIKLALSEVLLLTGRYEEALTTLNELLPHPKAQEFMVKIAYDQGDLEQVFERSITLLRERPCSPDLIEYAVNATLELPDLEGHLATLFDLISVDHLYPNQAVLFLQLQLIVGRPNEARHILSSLSERSMISLSDERLLNICEAAKRLQDSTLLKRWTSLGLGRDPHHVRLSFLKAVSLWWAGEHEEAVDLLYTLYLRSEQSLEEEELVTLTIWLCELKRGREARPLLDLLYKLPAYLQGVIDSGGVDVIKARVLLYSKATEEQEHAQRALARWLEQIQEDEERDGPQSEHGYHEVYDRVLTWLLDAEMHDFASQLIERSLSSDPDSAELWALALRVYQVKGDLQLSLYALDRLRALGMLDDRLLLDRAEALEQLSRHAESLQAYHEAYQLVPDSYEVRLERALALIRAQHLNAAELELVELLQIARKEDEEGTLDDLPDRGLHGLKEAHFELPGERAAERGGADHSSLHIGPLCEHVLFLWLSQVFEHATLEQGAELLARLEPSFAQSSYFQGFQGLTLLWSGKTTDSLPLLKTGSSRDLYFAIEYVRALWESGLRGYSVAVLQECVLKAPHDLDYLKLLIERLIELGDIQSAHSFLLSLSCLDQEEAEELSPKLYGSLVAH